MKINLMPVEYFLYFHLYDLYNYLLLLKLYVKIIIISNKIIHCCLKIYS